MTTSLQTNFEKIVEKTSTIKDVTRIQELTSQWWRRIIDAYSEPQRHYHTVDHINSMWDVLDSTPEEEITDRGAVVLAILFHDIVYDPTAQSESNERQSIQLWQQFAEECGLDPLLTTNVSALIEATIKHTLPVQYPEDLPLFLDLDLEVLGRSRDRYAEYASQIRQEYAHYPEEAYCKKRVVVLQHLKAGDVYFTEYWKHRLTANAHENLDWESRQLARGVIPGHTTASS